MLAGNWVVKDEETAAEKYKQLHNFVMVSAIQEKKIKK